MSSQLPPNPNVNFFNNEYWINEATPLTQQIADTKYLKFPVAQGNETLIDVDVLGNASFQNTITIANGVNTSTFDMDGTNNLIFDNNVNSGGIVFKSNNSVGVEQTILSLSGNTGTTTGLPITANNGLTTNALTVNGTATIDTANITNTMSIYNVTNSTTFDMNASNEFTILNNVNSQSVGIFTKNGSGVNDTSLVVSSASGIKAIANGLAFTAQNSGSGLGTGQIYMGVGGTSSFNNIVQANDSAIIGASTLGADNGALSLACWNTNSVNTGGIRITKPTINMRGDNIQLNANTTLTSTTPQPLSNDSSTHIPTTAWVQSAITGGSLASPMPYYQAYYFLNAPANFDRYATIQFNFTGTNWGINDYFSISLRCSLITTTNNTAVAPNYATFNTIIDVYPARCPANNTNPSAYGVNPTQPNTTNFSLLNGSIYNGGLQSAYVITSAGAPYAPYGRWYFSNNYTIWTSGTAYPTTSPAPISPYIQYGTAEKSAFGFGLWGASITYSEFAINLQVINRGPNGVGQGITLTSNYTLGGGTGNTLNEVKVGL